MKIRTGFVSNSSSSSFICDVCGHVDGGMDVCLSDVYMSECVNGHIFCDDHLIKNDDNLKDEGHDEYESRYGEVSEKCCPICSLKNFEDSSIIKYLIKKHDLGTISAIEDEMRKEFKNYTELTTYLE